MPSQTSDRTTQNKRLESILKPLQLSVPDAEKGNQGQPIKGGKWDGAQEKGSVRTVGDDLGDPGQSLGAYRTPAERSVSTGKYRSSSHRSS